MHELTRAALRIVECLLECPDDVETIDAALGEFSEADSSDVQLTLAALILPDRPFEVVEHHLAGPVVLGGSSMTMLPNGREVVSNHHYAASAAACFLRGEGTLFESEDWYGLRARIIREGAKLNGTATDGSDPNEQSEALSLLCDSLTDRQRDCLQALCERKAFGVSCRMRASDIAERVEGSGAAPEGFKRPLADLAMQELVVSKTGREGGYYLTPRGKELAESGLL